jgi:hypothetical protein
MRVLLTRNLGHNEWPALCPALAGEEREVTPKDGARLVAKGLAVALPEPEPPAAEPEPPAEAKGPRRRWK